jgi:hypothetical protein
MAMNVAWPWGFLLQERICAGTTASTLAAGPKQRNTVFPYSFDHRDLSRDTAGAPRCGSAELVQQSQSMCHQRSPSLTKFSAATNAGLPSADHHALDTTWLLAAPLTTSIALPFNGFEMARTHCGVIALQLKRRLRGDAPRAERYRLLTTQPRAAVEMQQRLTGHAWLL